MNTYADYEEYKTNGENAFENEQEAVKYLKKASLQIDVLTYGRINRIGLENLSEHQRDLLSYVCCGLADFIFENSETLYSGISSYTLNGASVSFDKQSLLCVNGVYIPAYLYGILIQTGLCCLSLAGD